MSIAFRTPRLRTLVVGAFVSAVAVGAASFFWRAHMDRRLLRAEPDALSGEADLVRYAIARGEPAYRRHCASCHGADLKGDRVSGAPDLIDRDWLYGSGGVAEIQQTITYGIRSGSPKSRSLAVMPAFARPEAGGREKVNALSPSEIGDLIDFLFSIEGRPADQAAAARGALLYAEKGVCYDCHSRDVQGDQAIGAPNLADAIWLYGDGSRAALFRSIAQGRAGACPAFEHRLPPALLRAVAVFVHYRAQHAGAT
jgi:cytochrome c oxidase cbb3-type subunit 3